MPPARKQPATTTKPKKTFSFAKAPRTSSDGSSSKKAGRRRTTKKSIATFELFAAEYQKGEKAGQKSGAVYQRGRPRYGANEPYKKGFAKYLLGEFLRWNDDSKMYQVRVWTPKQARKLLKAARELEGGEEDLPEDIDEAIFDGATEAAIDVVPIKVEGEDMVAVMGTTYPWKDELKERGFTFTTEVEEDVPMWVAPKASVDMDDLTAAFDDYGFTFEVYDDAEGHGA
jgi:hypothetical protein